LIETTGGEINHCLDLLAVKPIEPFNYVVQIRPGFEILEIVDTGIRVPLRAQAPLTLPGMLSTPGHCDQSRAGISVLLFSGYRETG